MLTTRTPGNSQREMRGAQKRGDPHSQPAGQVSDVDTQRGGKALLTETSAEERKDAGALRIEELLSRGGGGWATALPPPWGVGVPGSGRQCRPWAVCGFCLHQRDWSGISLELKDLSGGPGAG